MQLTMFGGTKPLKITKQIRLIELFGGIGCQAQALTNIGAEFEHYRLCEFDKYAVASYNAIHGTSFQKSDIRDWSGNDLGICDTDKFEYIMTYSFPCQDLSIAGKQQGLTKGSGTRSGLLWEVERLLNECRELPQILLMENVTQVHGEKNMEDFRMWLEFLESKGYKNYYKDLNAISYGVAQNRDRCFMVSCLGDTICKYSNDLSVVWCEKIKKIDININEFTIYTKGFRPIKSSEFEIKKLDNEKHIYSSCIYIATQAEAEAKLKQKKKGEQK